MLINASPDLRQQLEANPCLQPRNLRGSPISSVVVTNGDLDHIAGLLSMREAESFTLYATQEILTIIKKNQVFDAMSEGIVARAPVELNSTFSPLPECEVELFPVPGKVPLYSESETVDTSLVGEQTVGVHIRANGRSVFYIPGCAAVPEDLKSKLQNADLLLFDGTLWKDDEMISQGLSQKTGQRMGHISMHGESGSIAAMENLGIKKKVFIHLNNSNPAWRPMSLERKSLEAAGWQVGQDSMEIEI